MSTFRFLHLADVHLDTTFLNRRASVREHLREDIRAAFGRGIDLAIDNRWDAVLIAGDLFDGERLSLTTERFLVNQVKRLDEAGIPTVYATGNHDNGGNLSRLSGIAWPEHFHLIADPKPRRIQILSDTGEHLATVVGSGHPGPRVSANLASAFPMADSGARTVGLLHSLVATAGGVEAHERYAPCSRADLERTGYAYWALGHVHMRQVVSDEVAAWYAGNIQGRHAGESGPKGGLAVTIDDSGAADVTFLDLAPTRWEVLRLDDLREVTQLEELSSLVRRRYISLCEEDEGDHKRILRLILSGACPFVNTLNEEGQLEELVEILLNDLGVLDIEIKLDSLTRPVDVESHRGQPHILSEALAIVDQLAEDPEAFAAMNLGALAGDPDDRSAYLQSLLDGLDRELVARMQTEGS